MITIWEEKINMRFNHVLLLPIIIVLALVGCANSVQTNEQDRNKDSPKVHKKTVVYTTIFPIYDFTRTIGGEYISVKSIIPPGAEAHDFEPSPKDMAALYEADLFIYNGAGLETWVENALKNIDKSKTTTIEAARGISMLDGNHEHSHEEEEQLHNEEHAYEGNEHTHGEEEHDHLGVDPHVWLDPLRAKKLAENIYLALAETDPTHKDEYKNNYEQLTSELESLHSSYESAVAEAEKHEFVVSHAAFTYMADRYHLEQIAISGLSPSDEPTQKELKELITLIEERNIKYIAFEELVENRIARTIQKETDTEGVILNPIENVTKEQFDNGVTYIDIMKENLETLKKVLEVNE